MNKELEIQSERTEGSASNWFKPRSNLALEGDLVLLVTNDLKRYVVKLKPHHGLHTHLGIFYHDQVIGQRLGTAIPSTTGHAALLMEPALEDLIHYLKRGTQIIYPKDAAYLVHRLNLRAGAQVIEAGTGSGGLTTALAWAVAPTGIVYSYEMRAEIHQLARNNLESIGLLPYVRLFQATIDDGFRQTDADALFLDVRMPWKYLPQVRAALRLGGFFASLVPTTNQVSELLMGLEEHYFADIAVEELLLRAYKPVPDRLRPDDNMNGHTGFLVSARCMDTSVNTARWHAEDRQRYRARVQTQTMIAAEEERRAAERQSGGKKYPPMPLPD